MLRDSPEAPVAVDTDTGPGGSLPSSEHAPSRLAVENVSPQIDGGRFAVKRSVGEHLAVTADIYGDGHDVIAADLAWRAEADPAWQRTPMRHLGNDRWAAAFPVDAIGTCFYRVEAWIDRFATWQRDTARKVDAQLDVAVEMLEGLALLDEARRRAGPAETATCDAAIAALREGSIAAALAGEPLTGVMRRHGDRSSECASDVLRLSVDRLRARVGAWYELFPRSCSPEPQRHGTFADLRARLPYIAELGFDVVYLPPIHPIGETNRKGPNNTLVAGPADPGSPWAIGSRHGGHDAIHPELGSSQDLRDLIDDAAGRGLEVALDLAFQCSPDHPWLVEHPEWFRWRPDGSIQYAENPPKRYEDIVPFEFECEDWPALWRALHAVVEHWIEHGVRIFRVDNPHTKPFRFWEWLIAEVRRAHPDVFFLAEAFTRPKVMYQLAKAGFSQSYTYFAWRQSKAELTDYLTELTRTELADYFRPNFWPNTPDILTEQLQLGVRSVFVSRLVLAATLSANYGIYGPAYELMEHVARPGAEEYLDNEKYEIRVWDLDRASSLRHLIARVNRIRRRHPALQTDRTLQFHSTDNDALLCWSKSEHDPRDGDPGDVVIVVVNLDPHHRHAGWIDFDVTALGIDRDASFQLHDELTDARYLWRGPRVYVELDPASSPAHIMAVRRKVRSEHDFDYFM